MRTQRPLAPRCRNCQHEEYPTRHNLLDSTVSVRPSIPVTMNIVNIVTDLINALPRNSSVNAVHYATIGRMFIARC
jgi:hypothetical protein